MHQRSVLPPLLFTILVDVIMENTREGLNIILYGGELVVMSENKEDLREVF